MILSVFSIGLSCLIWDNQSRASNQTDKIIKKIEEYNNEVKSRVESVRSHSAERVWIHLQFTLALLGRVLLEAEKLDTHLALSHFQKEEPNLRLALEAAIRIINEEMKFLIPNITGDQRIQINKPFSISRF